MFSLDSSDKARRKQSPVLASLTDSLNLHRSPWQSSKVQVYAPRICAKRVPGKQLRVIRPPPPDPATIFHLQRKRALHAVVALTQQVHCAVLCWRRAVVHTLSLAAFHLQGRRGAVQHSQSSTDHLKLPWRRHSGAQSPALRVQGPEAVCKQKIEEGLAAEHALDMRKAVECFAEVVKHMPNNAHYLALLAKQLTDCTYLDVGPAQEHLSDAQRREFNRTALTHAQQAIALDENAALPHIAACTSMGRLALLSDNKTKVSLAHDARQEAVIALAAEPSNDLAHHLMGRWHSEMANLNMVARAVVRVVYGTSLAPGSHHDALDSYQKAVALAPTRLIHRVELGRTLDRLGRKEEARDELQAALDMDVEDINAHLQRKDAERLLKQLPKRQLKPASAPFTSPDPIRQATSLGGQSSVGGASATA